MSEKLFSVCMPTYNRGSVLEKTLPKLIELLKPHSIPLFISDNGSTDNTEDVIHRFKTIYKHIYYNKNKTNLGIDVNLEKALKMSNTKYRWLLGDANFIINGAIEKIMQYCSADKYDIIVLNDSKGRVMIPTREYQEKNEFLEDIGWHMSWISGLIYRENVVESANFSRYYGTWFSLNCVISEYCALHEFSALWVGEIFLDNDDIVKKSSWGHMALDVFARKWTNCIMSLHPSYSIRSKEICLKNHSKYSRLFSIRTMCYMRHDGRFDYKQYQEYRGYLKYVTDIPRGLLLLISITPRIFFTILHKIKRLFGSM